MEIKDRIKAVRMAVGITQIKFAKRIAISTSYISEVEKGIKEVNERVLRLIVAEFNVNGHWLRTGQGSMFNEDVSAAVPEAMNLFKSLAPDYQDGALKILTILNEMSVKAENQPNK